MDSSHSAPCCFSDSLHEALWNNTSPNIQALKEIVEERMHSPCVEHHQLGKGVYARVFLFSLKDGSRVVGRVSLPVRERFKTEAEVASMALVQARTNIPVPRVYLFCSTPHNPVGAEWILMEYILGDRFVDCFDDLSHTQKCQTATDLADIMASLFSITSSFCGSVLYYESPDSVPPSRYNPDPFDIESSAWPLEQTEVSRTLLGPFNDIVFLDYPDQIPASSCGPFSSEREFLEAIAYRGIPATRPPSKPVPDAFEKVLEVYDAIHPSYPGFQRQFHFAHGDFSVADLLLDPETGHVTGLVDWEMAGFRPPWLSTVAPGWFDDDSCRFLMLDSQDSREGYDNETVEDAALREHFRTQIKMRSEALFVHHWNGVEMRAIFYNLCRLCAGNAEIWLQKYEKQEWPECRGKFPFDVMDWVLKRIDEDNRILRDR